MWFMDALIREYRAQDEVRVVELSLQAWAPVFASVEQVLGREIFLRLHPDWREDRRPRSRHACRRRDAGLGG